MSNNSEGELIVQLANLQTKIQKRLGGALSPHGISFTEYMVLSHLLEVKGKGMRRVDLAEKVGLSASGVTRLLNPMQKTGLISKEENARDARVSLVAITKAGEGICRDAEVSFNQTAEDLMAALSAKQQAKLIGFTHALL